MKTLVLRGGEGIERAAGILRRGGLCVIPTETVYGLACDAGNPEALARLRELKGRPPGKPFSTLVSGIPCGGNADIEKLARAFAPGPMTLVLPREGGAGSVGLRVPAHDTALALLRLCAFPLAAPSANAEGEAPPVTFDDALRRFDGKAECAIDGGDCARGAESTVLLLTAEPYRIARRGAVTKRAVENVLGKKIDGMTVVGITGGAGAGKTTATRVLKTLGAEIIDCDEVYHSLAAGPSDMLRELSASFPGVVSGGALDRKALGNIVFRDEKALAELNKITHSHVGREVSRLLREYDRAGAEIVAVEAIALIESGRAAACDLTVAVVAPEDVRVRRVAERDGVSEEYAAARAAAQKPEEFYRAGCDDTLVNGGDEREFERLCREYFAARLRGAVKRF